MGSDGPHTTVELLTLTVKGRRPDASTIRLLREKSATMNDISNVSGRCLFRRSLGTKSILTVRGYQKGRRQPYILEVELE